MNVKYVHLKDGTLIVFSKYVGLQHSEMAALLFEALPADTADAGFVDLYEDQFEVFGKSLSLGKEADGRTNRLLNEQADTFKVYMMENGQCFATNREVQNQSLAGIGLVGMRAFKIL